MYFSSYECIKQKNYVTLFVHPNKHWDVVLIKEAMPLQKHRNSITAEFNRNSPVVPVIVVFAEEYVTLHNIMCCQDEEW